MTASRSTSAPRWRAVRLGGRTTTVTGLRWEIGAALALAVVVSLGVFQTHILHGGFQSDDWANFSLDKFPGLTGHSTAFGALLQSAGSRIGGAVFWLAAFGLFTHHVKAYLLLAALLAALMAAAVYALVRELGFSRLQALAVMILTIVAPSVDTVRFWFTTSGSQLCLTLFFIGLILALRAFAAPPPLARRLHVASLVFYVASAAYAEIALPLMALAGLVYLTRASFVQAAKRWLCDMVIVIAGFVSVNAFITTLGPSLRLPASQWPEHLHFIADDALTIFTTTLAPFIGSRPAVLLGLAAIAAAGALAWRLPHTTATGRAALRRWAITSGIAALAVIVPLLIYVPAFFYYEPLQPGLGNHINSPTAAPLAVLIVAIIMFTATTVTELGRGLFSARPKLVTYPVVALALLWFGAVAVDGVRAVRNNANIWNVAARQQVNILAAIKYSVRTPVHNATFLTFHAPASVAPGMPTFYSPWEEESAVKVFLNRPDVHAYPVVAGLYSATCRPAGVQVTINGVVVSHSHYGHTYFVDVPANRGVLVASQRACLTELPRYPPGPLGATPFLSWAL